MSKGRLLGVAAMVLVGLVALGASAHASAGPQHDGSDCLACALCEWLNAVLD